MEEFGETNSRVSWIVAICVFVMTFNGQLMRPKKLDTKKNATKMKLLCKSYCTIVHTEQQFVLHGSSGPLSSVLTNRFGFQLVVMTGGLLISTGTIATSFATSINQMYITYGLVTGV